MTNYKKYVDVERFDDETSSVHCRTCGEEDNLDFVNQQCGECGGSSLMVGTLLEQESCAICEIDFEEFDEAWYSRSKEAYICDPCYAEHVKPLLPK